MYKRLDSIPAYVRWTDILPRHSPRYAYASRGENYDNMLSRFHLISGRHGQTDGRTDGQTKLLYQYRASVC